MLLVITVATWLNFGIPLCYQVASVLLAFYAIIAGISLWKNTPLGHWLSLPLQGVQVFQFVTSTFLLQTSIGFHLSYFEYTAGGLLIAPGFDATLGLWGAGHTAKPGMGINLLAFASMMLLLFGAGGILNRGGLARPRAA